MAGEEANTVQTSTVSESGSTKAGGRAGAGNVAEQLKEAEQEGAFTVASDGERLKAAEIAAGALTAVGGLNWGLVAIGRFDLVAALTGNRFGETNLASRIVYGAVGVAAGAQAVRLIQRVADGR